MPAALATALTGLLLGLSLIVAIGAQNAFVLRTGLQGTHVLPVVAVCALSDAVLIAAGVAGLGVLVDRAPVVLTVARLAGAAFLLGYAALAARRAWRPAGDALDAAGGSAPARLWPVVATCLALTWLNPHVYLDTVVLLGSVAGTHGGLRWWFAAGAAAGSVLWFTGLGYGARLLRPLFARPGAWRVLDAAIALVMAAIAVSLLRGL
ncbi:LysE/ArgO family amino acid transporter [Cellulomonas sp. ES6]|uniref:LysE/ArgO family amino acid transporter n=1 Tax=Cellulomonas sp. ES6 TaxID=3039384 RepID=UPI0019B6E847|nr:LysE/ArgO family amino acid transporter [Cellulomonas sp. ES6]MBD3779496.1 amino acid transporter [Micrococcales bacterium]WHP17655.1 LysE/ArgO family amino acid transporter [Cellulomonas sp. ES6]